MEKVNKEQIAVMDAIEMSYNFYNELVALKLGEPFARKQADKSAKMCVDNMLAIISYIEMHLEDNFSNEKYNDYVWRIHLMGKELSKFVESHED